ncbi:PilW family protein [Undibacterium sp. Ji67W]|uniref:PilW family protein n=1 Tax=Undibacterium sp. Ji67W TaxID=3413042 RepID=UPI003BF033DB
MERIIANRTKFAGFSLIELMIAITVTMVLVAGIVGLIFSLKQSFLTQDALTQIQENERFALSVMDSTIRNAGYYPGAENFTTPSGTGFLNQASGQLSAFPATAVANSDGTKFSAGQIIVGTTVAGGNDTINVRVIAASGSTITNCQGDTNSSGSPIVWTSSFSINASNQLVCTVSVNGATPGTPTVLADNVSSMKIIYGAQTLPLSTTAGITSVPNVDTYIDGSSLNVPQTPSPGQPLGAITPINWMYVMSAQVTLTFANTVVSNSGVGAPNLKPIVHTIYLMNVT